MKTIHILAALLALVAGFVALAATKGGTLHRRAGSLFAVAMLLSTGSAWILSGFVHPNRGNFVAASLTFVLVATGWLAVRRTVEQMRGWLFASMLACLAVGWRALLLADLARHDAHGVVDSIPGPPLLLFGAIALLAALGDARVLLAGRLDGRRRIARHLWRMTFALWIAAASGFLGQAKHVPAPFRHLALLALPVLAVAIALVYWLVRTLWGGPKAAPTAARRAPAPGALARE
jgi:uncharacterized membrane protein